MVGEITFSTRLGFLESDTDVEGIMNDIWKWFEYVAVVSKPKNACIKLRI